MEQNTNFNGAASPEEKEQLRRLKEGDLVAFKEIYDKWFLSVRIFVTKFINDEDEVKDLMQEVFIRLWNYKESLNIEKPINWLLFTIAKNYIRKQVSRAIKQKTFIEELPDEKKINISPFEDNLETAQLSRLIIDFVNKLPEKRKDIFVKSRYNYLSHSEIAKELNISVSTVNNQLTLTLRELRELLAKTY